MNHGNMIENRVDTYPHLLLSKIVDQLQITITYCIHEGIPVVGSHKLVDKMRESVEKVYD